jgi:hypothetical protein
VSQLLSHNNVAERPFGIVKAYLDVYKTMKLSTLANFSLAITNGSHHPGGTSGKKIKTKLRVPKAAGIAVTSPDALKYYESVWDMAASYRGSNHYTT